jgi:hypothetical protein
MRFKITQWPNICAGLAGIFRQELATLPLPFITFHLGTKKMKVENKLLLQSREGLFL